MWAIWLVLNKSLLTWHPLNVYKSCLNFLVWCTFSHSFIHSFIPESSVLLGVWRIMHCLCPLSYDPVKATKQVHTNSSSARWGVVCGMKALLLGEGAGHGLRTRLWVQLLAPLLTNCMILGDLHNLSTSFLICERGINHSNMYMMGLLEEDLALSSRNASFCYYCLFLEFRHHF